MKTIITVMAITIALAFLLGESYERYVDTDRLGWFLASMGLLLFIAPLIIVDIVGVFALPVIILQMIK